MKSDPKEKKVLIVDDDPEMVRYIGLILEYEGFRTCSTNDGRGISDIVRKEDIDLIIFDLMMPYVGGYEGIRNLQMHEDTKGIPIFIVSAKNIDRTTESMLKMEPNVKEFFQKPLNRPVFVQRVHGLLNTLSSDEKIIMEYRKKHPEG